MRLFASLLMTCALLLAERFDVNTPGRIIRPSDPQVSPDGKQIAAIVTRANFEENRNDSQLVMIDTATGAERILVHERRGLAQPRWSPDGTRLAFLAAVDGKPRIFVLPMGGGEALAVTRAGQGVQQYAWSPDGATFAFVTTDEPGKKDGPERHNRSFEIAHNDFLTAAAPLPAHLWVVPSGAGGQARRVTSGAWTLPISFPPSPPAAPLTWTPDGKSVAIVRMASVYSGDFDQATVQICDVATGQMRALTGRSRNEAQPLISPDGKRVSYWSPRDGDTKNVNEIYVAPIAGGEGRSVTRAIDRNVQRAIWMADGQSLLVSANDGTGVGLWVQPLEGAARRVEMGSMVATAAFWLDASVNGRGQIAVTGSEPGSPVEIYVLDSVSARPRRLTHYNKAISALELGKTETVRWAGPDGFGNDGVVTYPPDFAAGRKYPLVLYIHGGPRSASKEAFSTYAQLFAAQGWVVFEPNYRGSDNLGNAYQSAIWNDAGAGPGRDAMSGVEMLKKRGFVDEGRMATCGWSYGGYMTTWLLGNYPKVWRAAVAGASVTDWMDQYNLGDANVRRGSAFGGSPYTDGKRMEQMRVQSPMAYAGNVTAPTLILATTGDYRVPITQSYRFYHALRDRGVPTQFIGYPVAGHFPTDPVHQRDVYRRYVGWLKQYLGDK